jgi:hypothetical protein
LNSLGIWSTAAEKKTNRPSTSSSYSRVSQPISFVSGGLKSGLKTEQKKSTTGTKKTPILIESYDSDEDSDEQLDNDDDDDDDDVEIIEKKRKKRKDSSEEDDSDIEEEEEQENKSNRRHGSVRE